MPDLRPFRAVHYDLADRPDLSKVLAPPFDEIDDLYREVLEARDPHNIVRLEKERERPGAGGEDRYARSARWLEEWLAAGVLIRDRRPALWVTEQRFVDDGRERVRRGFFARLRLHPFEDGVVLPHERTEERPWRDRLALYRATRMNVSPVHVLYPDDRGALAARLEPVTARPPDAVGRTERDGTQHRLWRVDEAAFVAGLQADLAPLRVYIADGHHRYLSSLAYARWCEEEGGGRGEGAHRWVLACFTSMADPGLVIRPTHRVVRGLPTLKPGPLFTLLDEHFEVERLEVDPAGAAGRAWALRRLAEAGRSAHAFLALARGDRALRLLVLKEGIDLAHVAALPRNPTLRALDAELLDGLVLRNVLGVDPDGPEAGANLAYVASADEAMDRVLSPEGDGDAAFFLNPTPMWQVRAVAEAREVMPRSSATLFPRLPGGLVMAGIDPAEVE